MTFDLALEIAGFCLGIVYLWWEYHADPKVWFASVVMPAVSMWIYFSKGLYADFAINIYYLALWCGHAAFARVRTPVTAKARAKVALYRILRYVCGA